MAVIEGIAAQHVLNDHVNIVIENHVEHHPTVMAEAATAKIMRQLIEVAASAPPELRGQVEGFKRRIEGMIFDVVQETVRKAVARDREGRLRVV